jgi:hypothetical protein
MELIDKFQGRHKGRWPMTKGETEFNEILTSLKQALEKPTAPDRDSEWSKVVNYALGYREPDPHTELLIRNLIKIMESGIFREGGLKGKIIQQTQLGRVDKNKVWPISNLVELLTELTAIMKVSAEPEKNIKKLVSGYFDNLLKAFVTPAALARLGGVRKETIEKTKKELTGWKEKTIKRIPKIKEEISLEIAEALIAHIPPKTPDLTIAERANELLAAFGKKGIEVDTLRKKIAKKRENQTQAA